MNATGGDSDGFENGAGAGIGGGFDTGGGIPSGNGGTVTITGNANVTATGGNAARETHPAPGIGGGGGNGGWGTVLGGEASDFTNTSTGNVTATGGTHPGGAHAPGIQPTFTGIDLSPATVLTSGGEVTVTITGTNFDTENVSRMRVAAFLNNAGAALYTSPAPAFIDATTATITLTIPPGAVRNYTLRPSNNTAGDFRNSPTATLEVAAAPTATIDLSNPNPPNAGIGWTRDGDVFTITGRDADDVTVTVTVIGDNQYPAPSQRRLAVAANATNVNVTLDNVSITGLSPGQSPLLLNAGADATVTLV